MKSIALITIAIVATMLAACNKDNEPEANYNGEIRLCSGVQVEARASTPTQGTTIAKDETVSIWVDDAKTPNNNVTNEHLYKAYQFTADGTNGLTAATGDEMYFPQTGNEVNIFAIHGNFDPPFKKGDEFPTGDVTYEVKTQQNETKNYTQSDLLYAYSTNVARTKKAVTLTFYHILSKVEVAIKVGVGAPELAYSDPVKLNGVTLSGKFTPSKSADMSNPSQRAKMLELPSTLSPQSIILGQKLSTDFASSNYNEAVVVPQSMKGKTLTFTLKDGGTLTYDFPDVTLTSGKKYQYQITLNLTTLTVDSKVEDWETVGDAPVQGDAEM